MDSPKLYNINCRTSKGALLPRRDELHAELVIVMCLRCALASHVSEFHAATDLGEDTQEANVQHAWHLTIWWQRRAGHTTKELGLNLAAGGDGHAAQGTTAAAQAGCARLAARINLQAQPGLLCCTADVIHLWHAAIVATAAS